MPELSTKKSFFISYFSEDYEIASMLNEQLKKKSYDTFFDKESLFVGDNWRAGIYSAIKDKCDYFILLWSSSAEVRRESFIPIELHLAREKHKKRQIRNSAEPFIFPVCIGETTEIPSDLEIGDIQMIRLINTGEKGINELILKILGRIERLDEKLLVDFNAKGELKQILDEISTNYRSVIVGAKGSTPTRTVDFNDFDYISAFKARNHHIAESVARTIENNTSTITEVISCFMDWMTNETIVRIIGAGRAKLAATMPANRLAHGGARVYLQDGIVPMPHDIKGGGIIAASASGTTPSVLSVLREIKRKRKGVNSDHSPFKVIGIANGDAAEFRQLCDKFIGICISGDPNPLRALADTEEHVISMVLDALVVSAGWKAGFDDTRWRLGHENLGATGPYDTRPNPSRPLFAPYPMVTTPHK